MRFSFFGIVVACVASLVACKQESRKATPTDTGNTPASPAVSSSLPKPEVFVYAVMVNDLLLREAANQEANSVAKLREADFVTGTGNSSPNKEEVELRGLTYTDNYYEVTTTTPEQKQGWAFGGGLALVYTGSRAQSPDLGRLSQLAATFKGLNARDLNSGKKAWDYVSRNFGDASGPLADAVYILYERFARRMENEGQFYRITEAMKWTEADYKAIYDNTFDLSSRTETKQLADNMFTLDTGEGMVFPVPDYHRMEAFFAPKVTAPMQAYLAQRTKEQKDPESEDGGLAIAVPVLAERAVFWEKFNRDYPYFPLYAEALESQRWMTLSLLNGMDNTPITTGEDQTISEDFKKAWAETAQQYPDTEIGRKCREIYDLCAAQGWKYTKAVEDWQAQLAEQIYPH